MSDRTITAKDLERFKEEILKLFREDVARVIDKALAQKITPPSRRWLKTNDVIRLLLVSPGTLAAMRKKGELPFRKIGNVIFYDYADIEKMMYARSRPPAVDG